MSKEIKSISDCKYFNECEAPMCPLYNKFKDTIWFVDEDVCKLSKFSNLLVIKNQKKIQKKTQGRDPNEVGYFTYDMLNRRIRVTSKIKGIVEEEGSEDNQIKKWIKNHKNVKVDQERVNEKMKKIREKKKI